MSTPLLSLEHLTISLGNRRVVDDLNLQIQPGERLALVGESGSGKTVTALSILRLLAQARIQGSIRLEGQELLEKTEAQIRQIRGRDVAMIFQEPMSALNPLFSIGEQIIETLQLHEGLTPREARARTIALLARTGIREPERRVDSYPHQLSGGQLQRAVIAMALACRPKLLIADEPTTALDVTIQAQILDLLRAQIADRDAALLLITHDLGVVAGMCETVHVMYAGRIVESADRYELFGRPRHPYTAGLLASVPRLDQPRGDPLHPIKGSARDTIPWSRGCAFAPRCGNRVAQCTAETPELEPDGPTGHLLRCFNPVGAEEPEEVAR
jgi:peptide/nickel transport system ATP-binding protein